jgi:hypothetical protein
MPAKRWVWWWCVSGIRVVGCVSQKRCGRAWWGGGGGGTMWVPGWGIVAVWGCLGHLEHAYPRGSHATPCNAMQLFKQLWTAPCNCLSNCLSVPCNSMQRHATVYTTAFRLHATPCNAMQLFMQLPFCPCNAMQRHATVYATAFWLHATPCNAMQLFMQLPFRPCNAMQRHATVYATVFRYIQRHATPCICLCNCRLAIHYHRINMVYVW